MARGMKVDLHVHTLGSDGRSTAEEIVERALMAGLDGFAITDHHWVGTSEGDAVEKLARKCGLVVFRGVEYSSSGGHMLLFGVDDRLVTSFGFYKDAQAVIDAVNAAGGCAVVSHPFKGYKRAFRAEVGKLRGLVAWEGFNGQVSYESPFNNREARDLARKLRRRTTGGSDAHDARDLGLSYTLFPRRFSTDRELVRALRRGGYRAVLDEKRAEGYRVWRRERFSSLDKLTGGVSLVGRDIGDPPAAASYSAASSRSLRTVSGPYVSTGSPAAWTTGEVDEDEDPGSRLDDLFFDTKH